MFGSDFATIWPTLEFVIGLANAGALTMFVKGLFAYLTKGAEIISGPVTIKIKDNQISVPQGLTSEAIDTYTERFFKMAEKDISERSHATNTE